MYNSEKSGKIANNSSLYDQKKFVIKKNRYIKRGILYAVPLYCVIRYIKVRCRVS